MFLCPHQIMQKMNELCVNMGSVRAGYLGNTRSKVGGPLTSSFYVWFVNQINIFNKRYIF